jgi:hypothetical protein
MVRALVIAAGFLLLTGLNVVGWIIAFYLTRYMGFR